VSLTGEVTRVAFLLRTFLTKNVCARSLSIFRLRFLNPDILISAIPNSLEELSLAGIRPIVFID